MSDDDRTAFELYDPSTREGRAQLAAAMNAVSYRYEHHFKVALPTDVAHDIARHVAVSLATAVIDHEAATAVQRVWPAPNGDEPSTSTLTRSSRVETIVMQHAAVVTDDEDLFSVAFNYTHVQYHVLGVPRSVLDVIQRDLRLDQSTQLYVEDGGKFRSQWFLPRHLMSVEVVEQ